MINDNNIPEENMDPENEFEVPQGYFESFANRLFPKIELVEEIKEFPMLSSLEKENWFIVPENYFENRDFAGIAMKDKTEEKTAVVVNLFQSIKRYKYAIAAVFALLIATAVFFTLNNKTEVKTDCGDLACLTKEDITNSNYFEQISLEDLEAVTNTEMLDSIGTKMNDELLKEIIADPEAMNITDEDLGI